MSALSIPQIWIPRREWFCPTCGKPRLSRRHKRRALLRKLLGPLAWFAAGDVMFDSSGNVILDSSGNVQLDDGSGNSCCCETPSSCVCNSGTGAKFKNNVTLTISGCTIITGVCHPKGGGGTISNPPTYIINSCNINKTYVVPYDPTNLPGGCNYTLIDTTSASMTVYSGALCTGTTTTDVRVAVDVTLNTSTGLSITVWPYFGGTSCDVWFSVGNSGIFSTIYPRLTCGGTQTGITNEANHYGSSTSTCSTNPGGTATLSDGP